MNSMSFKTTSQKSTQIRSKCNWFGYCKKSTLDILFNFEKQWGSQNTIEKLVLDDKEITDLAHILIHIGILSSTFQKKTGT